MTPYTIDSMILSPAFSQLATFKMTTLTPFHNSTTDNKEIYRQLRKNTSTHDIYNRLHSINRDLDFVQKVAEEWYLSQFKVLANQRCGTWYVDPLVSTKSSQTPWRKAS
jgi:hypothetical protein